MRLHLLMSFIVFVYVTTSCLAMPTNEKYQQKQVGYKYSRPLYRNFWARLAAKEPTCEELRAMWHFSKYQARMTEVTNELPLYNDPFANNIWDPYTQSRMMKNYIQNGREKEYVYGKVVRYPQYQKVRPHTHFDEVVKLLGDRTKPRPNAIAQPSPPFGYFQRVRNIIRLDRSRDLQEEALNPTDTEDSGYYPPKESILLNRIYGAAYGRNQDEANTMDPIKYQETNEAPYSDLIPDEANDGEDETARKFQDNRRLYKDDSQP